MSSPEDTLRGDATWADLQLDASEWIAEHGTDKLVADLKEAVAGRRRVKLGTTNVLILLRHMDELEAERDRLRERLEDTENSRAAWQTSCERAEAERDRYKQALEEARLALTRARASVALEMYGGSRSNTAKHIDAARAALDDKEQP